VSGLDVDVLQWIHVGEIGEGMECHVLLCCCYFKGKGATGMGEGGSHAVVFL
jgi:hypothetical protein